MLLVLGIILAAAIVAVVVLVVALGWVDHLSLAQRLGLTARAGGLVWAAPYRAMQAPVGPGDVLFLLAVAPLFAPTEFLRFLIAACVVALLRWVCCGRRRRTIPFVGAAGIVLIGWAALQFLRLWL